jgi:hypothetical protein
MLQNLDEESRQQNDKAKKELFKKISSHLIGRNVLADFFRNDPVKISDLHLMNNNNSKRIQMS